MPLAGIGLFSTIAQIMLYVRITGTLLLVTALASAQVWQDRDPNDNPAARLKAFYDERAYPTGHIPGAARANAIRELNRIDAAARIQHREAAGVRPLGLTLDSSTWTLIGPKPSDSGPSETAGRVNGIAIDPRDNNTVYISTAS